MRWKRTEWGWLKPRVIMPALIALEGVLAQYVRQGLETGEPHWEQQAQQLREQICSLKEWILCRERVSSLTDTD